MQVVLDGIPRLDCLGLIEARKPPSIFVNHDLRDSEA